MKHATLVLLVALLAAGTIYFYETDPTQQAQPLADIDLNCGFTDDFTSFLAKSKTIIIKNIPSGTSLEKRFHALPMEGGLIQKSL
jgi:hypothetical protein